MRSTPVKRQPAASACSTRSPTPAARAASVSIEAANRPADPRRPRSIQIVALLSGERYDHRDVGCDHLVALFLVTDIHLVAHVHDVGDRQAGFSGCLILLRLRSRPSDADVGLGIHGEYSGDRSPFDGDR